MTWKFENRIATFQCGPLAGKAAVQQPQQGLHQLRIESIPLSGRICSVERDTTAKSAIWPPKLVDSYVRGDDLVAAYKAADDWPFAVQLYWRADPHCFDDQVLCSLSLQISVSTHLLDTHPRIFAVSELAYEEVMQVIPSNHGAHVTEIPRKDSPAVGNDSGACCLLWRLPGGESSYAEIVPVGDFREITVHPNKGGMCQTRWEVIAEFLEKGVIRRTRLHAVFLPRDSDIELAAECCRNFVARPLPLTT